MANGRRQNPPSKKANCRTTTRYKSARATIAKIAASRTTTSTPSKSKSTTSNGHSKTSRSVSSRVERAIEQVVKKTERKKVRVAEPVNGNADQKRGDRVVLLVRDAYWLHVFWELSQAGVKRIEAAFGQEWYGATPILRLVDVSSDDSPCSSEKVVKDIQIRDGVRNWYMEIDGTPRTFRVDIGYKTLGGRFFTLARSNIVNTPRPGRAQTVDRHWESVEEDCERIFALTASAEASAGNDELKALLEERLQRPLNPGSLSEYGRGALDVFRTNDFNFDMDAELIVHGKTVPHARVTLEGEPINIRADGSFTLRYRLPDGRQVLPVVAKSSDGIEERTIILAVERNTKLLEPTVHDGQE